MSDMINLAPQSNHMRQWLALKSVYMDKRGSDAGPNRKAIPRTTYGDVAQLTRWWHVELERALLRNPYARDNDLPSRRRWLENKQRLDAQLDGADLSATYPDNVWFWRATRGLALYLQGRKAVPSHARLLFEAFAERATELADAASDVADKAGDKAGSLLKTSIIIGGSVIGAAVILPPVIRALRDKP